MRCAGVEARRERQDERMNLLEYHYGQVLGMIESRLEALEYKMEDTDRRLRRLEAGSWQ